ncbi:trifunctional histidinol dehydrogenase, partial [Dimargaris xerosporica]
MLIPRLAVSDLELSPTAQSALFLPTVVLAAATPASLCELMRAHTTGGRIGRWWLEPSTNLDNSDSATLRHWPLETEAELLNAGAARVMADILLSTTASLPDAETLVSLATTPVDRRIIRLVVKDIEALQAVASSSISWVTTALPSLTTQVLVQLPTNLATSSIGQDAIQALQGHLAQLPQPIALAVQLDSAGVDLTRLQKCFAADQSVVYPIDGLSTAWPAPTDHLNLAEAFLAGTQSDRPDQLIPTVVVNAQRVNLGLVYSSAQSLSEALRTGAGVYQSRKRGLWYKGQTSGATQQLLRVSIDCDADALEVMVAQTAPGFCHLNRMSCFGESAGLARLAETLEHRKQEAVAGSYTQRLFNDSALLRAKIMEEAEELCDATEPSDIAWEAADVIYFALTKCVAHGVSLSDVEVHIDARAMKVTRRPGNAKRKWQAAPIPEVQPPAKVTVAGSTEIPSRIAMAHHTLADLSVDQQKALFQRPIIQSDSIMATVEPIVRDVRTRGDTALKHYTEKFDKVTVEYTVLQAPFDPSLLQGLSDSVRAAIDQAYANIRAFHEAQLPQRVLTVETMPGVVCSRFSRPIER